MAAFPRDADTTHPPDFALLRNGGLALFLVEQVLSDAVRELVGHGYSHTALDASTWDEATLHDDLARALDFPAYYGRNLDAPADCLYDVAHGDYGWDSKASGLVVTVADWGAFAERHPPLALDIADVFAQATAAAMLFGHRLIWLLHVHHGDYRLGPVGGFQVPWNGREWLDAKRR